MVNFARRLGASTLRLREVKTFDRSIFVFADDCFEGLSKRPFCEGCDTIVPYFDGMSVRVKNMCGYPSEIKREYYGVKNPAVYGLVESCGIQATLENKHFAVNEIKDYSQLVGKTFCVMYTDGRLYDGWVCENNQKLNLRS